MYCGVEFKGQLECRDSSTPRWLYELEKQLDQEAFWDIEERWMELSRSKNRRWEIQERSFCLKPDGTDDHVLNDWHRFQLLKRGLTAHQAFDVLLRVRKDAIELDLLDAKDFNPEVEVTPRRFCRDEYRVRRVDG
jgi:hypothetical protein